MSKEAPGAVICRLKVALAGYRIAWRRPVKEAEPTRTGLRETFAEPIQVLVEKPPADPSKRYREYEPMTAPAFDKRPLYLQLADIRPGDDEAVRKFADGFGPLGLPVPTDAGDGGDRDDRSRLNEPLFAWATECGRLREAIWLWSTLKEKNWSELRDRITVKRAGDVKYWRYETRIPEVVPGKESGGSDRWVAMPVLPSPELPFRERDYMAAGWGALRDLINGGLKEISIPHAYSNSESKKPLRQRIEVTTLRTAAWQLLMQAIEGGRLAKPCPMCGTMFVVGDGREARRIVCSDKCKFRRLRRISKSSTRKGKK
jgi:hypothetical protein